MNIFMMIVRGLLVCVFHLMYLSRKIVRGGLLCFGGWLVIAGGGLFGLMSLAEYPRAWEFLIFLPLGFIFCVLAWYYDILLLKIAPENVTLILMD